MMQAGWHAARVFGLGMVAMLPAAHAQTVFTHTDEATGTTTVNAAPEYHTTFQGSGQQIWFTLAPNTDYTGPRQGGFEFLYVALVPPPGEAFKPGVYTDVGCRGLAGGRSAGMDVTEENPVCTDIDRVWGWISIRQLEFDEAGQIVKLDAAFSQRLDAADNPGRVMVLRHNAQPQSFTIEAGRMSPYGAISRTFHGDEAFFSLAGDGNSAGFAAAAPKNDWRVLIGGPEGETLQRGRYTTDAYTATGWWVDISRGAASSAVTCNGPGTLDVVDVEYDGAGQLTALRASFSQACGSGRAVRSNPFAKVSGEIRYNR